MLLGLVLIMLITLANLRGIKESGAIFSFPTYLYIVHADRAHRATGSYRVFFGNDIGHVPLNDPRLRRARVSRRDARACSSS